MPKNIPRTGKRLRPKTAVKGKRYLCAKCRKRSPADSVELISMSRLPETALIEVGQDHRLADPEPLKALLKAVEGRG